ncbi:MFS transporter [Actinomadura vinacea]|uniref:MFS transporter n=1 Tax=Actinomadura vinacea TaxID=115336 RepID=A0ABN3IQ41_9ACTN
MSSLPSHPTPDHEPLLSSACGKIMRRIVPIFAIMMFANQLDRANIGYAEHHLEADLGIGAAAYGLGAGLFFIAYVLFELPSNALMDRFGPRLWLSRICVTWGLVSALMFLVQGEISFYVLRFLLGIAEAGFVPAVLYYLTQWLPNTYRGRANARYAVGALVAFSVGGVISGPLLAMDGVLGLHGWQWMFLIEGLLSVAIGVFAFFRLESRIENASWLTQPEKDALQAELDAERRAAAATADHPRWWTVLRDRKVALFAFIYFTVQMSIYANTFWLPSVVRGIDRADDITVGLLSSLPWICAIVSMFTLSRIGDRTGRRKELLIGALLTAAVGSLGAALVGPVLALVMLCVAAMGFKSISPIFWPIVQRQFHPVTVGFTIAIVNSIANLGGFVAPYGFGLVKEHTGSTQWGLIALALLSAVAAVATLFVRNAPRIPDSGTQIQKVGHRAPTNQPPRPTR